MTDTNRNKEKRLTKEDWLFIAQNYSSEGPKFIAEKLGVSRQRVHQVAVALRKNGIKVSHIRKPLKETIEFVKSNLK